MKCLVLLAGLFLVFWVGPEANADFEWALGGKAGGGSFTGGYYDYNCYSIEQCPRWMKVTKDVYNQIVSEGRLVGSYSELPTCNTDNYVIIAGNQRHDGSLQIYNLTSNLPRPEKWTHIYTSTASSLTSVVNHTDWSSPNSTSFFAELNGDGAKDENDGHVLTYAEILQRAIEKSGANETDLAIFCSSMVSGSVDSSVDPYGSSSVSVGNSFADTGIVNRLSKRTAETSIESDQYVSVSFRHYVYERLTEYIGRNWCNYIDYIPERSITWEIRREFSTGGVGYILNSAREGESSGVAIFGELTRASCDDPDDSSLIRAFTHLEEGTTAYNPDGEQYTPRWVYMIPTNFSYYPHRDDRAGYATSDDYSFRFTKNGTYPFCESLYVGGEHLTRVCAEITVNVDNFENKDDDDGGGGGGDDTCRSWKSSTTTTDVLTKVKNISLGGGYGDGPVYAKPGDTIDWLHCYYPGVQSQIGVDATLVHSAHQGSSSPDETEFPNVNGTVLEKFEREGKTWENKFSIGTDNLRPLAGHAYGGYTESFEIGDTTVRRFGGDNRVDDYAYTQYVVQTGQAGETLTESITSGSPTSVSVVGSYDSWECGYTIYVGDNNQQYSRPYRCNHGSTPTYENDFGGQVSDSADALVPYNFTTMPSISLSKNFHDGENIVYSGEAFRISNVEVAVKTRYNNVTKGDYATEVPGATVRTYVYLSNRGTGEAKFDVGYNYSICDELGSAVLGGRCSELRSVNVEKLNDGANVHGSNDTIDGLAGSFNAYDYDAGSYICVVAAVWPSNSGSYTSMSSSGFSGWSISAPSCAKIAKRPSFQVWGGSLYSVGNVKTSIAAKTNIDGKYSYVATGNENRTVFGSWVEQDVVGIGIIDGLASGSADGGGLLVRGGNDYYCSSLVPLSFANYSTILNDSICPYKSASGKISQVASNTDRSKLLNYWIRPNDTDAILDGDISMIDITRSRVPETTSISGKLVKYVDKRDSGILRVSSAENIGASNTYIIRAGGDIEIGSDIKYSDGTFASLGQIPKVVMYSKGNIDILCNVARVDAILIAEGTVDTCSDGGDNINSSRRSKQLVINGVVIADELVLGRTYGAGRGASSDVPAEIINYDSSALLWGVDMADVADSNKLTETYLHELAPRY